MKPTHYLYQTKNINTELKSNQIGQFNFTSIFPTLSTKKINLQKNYLWNVSNTKVNFLMIQLFFDKNLQILLCD